MSIRKPFLVVAVFAIIIITAFLLLPQTAMAANVTLDLSNINPAGVLGEYSYDATNRFIGINGAGANDTVTIKGNGSAGYSIEVLYCQNIVIEDNTTIVGIPDYAALDVANGTTITGQGSNISITGFAGIFGNALTINGTLGNITGTGSGIAQSVFCGSAIFSSTGNITINGTVGNVTGNGPGSLDGNAIYADNGDVIIAGTVGNVTTSGHGYGIWAQNVEVTISGTVGHITGAERGIVGANNVTITGHTGNITGNNGSGIYAATGQVEISGTVGAITGTGSAVCGITAPYGSVTISGAVTGDIKGAYGIDAGQSVTISGTVKNIIANSGVGISAFQGNVEITGSAGNITGGSSSYGIAAYNGSVTVTGRVGTISGGLYDVYAYTLYAVYDYVGVGGILDISQCNPAGYTVTFDYGTGATATGLPVCVYVSGGNTIPDYAAATGFAIDWYKEVAAITPWVFASDTVGADTILYTGNSWGPFVAATLPNGAVGVPYNQALAVGTGPITVTLDGGSNPLPTGLSISGTSLTGTPTTQGTFTFTITVNGTVTQTISLWIGTAPPVPPNSVGSSGFFVFTAPKAATRAASFPAEGKVVGSRITVYKLEALKTTLFRLNKGEAFNVLGLANGGRALLIEKDGREGYVALKDIGFTLETPIKATALKKAAAYTKLSTGKLKRIGYYDKNQVLYIYGISGKYLINKQANATYYLDAGQWKLSLAQ